MAYLHWFYGGQYAPLAFLSYLVLYAGFGYDPFYFHMFSLLLHIGCVCLVWKLISSLLRVHGGVSEKQILYVNFITTLLFAVHPINVEAVAWISALKVLLYAFSISWGYFVIYVIYEHQRFLLCINDRVLSLFFLGKGTGCYFSTGIVDRRLVYEPEYEKSWGLEWENVVSHYGILFGIITVLSQGKGPYEMIFPLYQRLLFGCFALVEYITKSLLPVNLNFFYPFPIVLGEEPPLHYYLYPVVLLFLMGWIIAYRNNRYLVFGVLLFLVNLLFSIHLLICLVMPLWPIDICIWVMLALLSL